VDYREILEAEIAGGGGSRGRGA